MRQGGSRNLALVAAAALAVACGRTADHGSNPASAGAGAEPAEGWDVLRSFDGEVTGLSVVSDRDGGALVAWGSTDGQMSFARWDATNHVWSFPPPVALKSAGLLDTYRSGHPLLVGNAATTNLGEASSSVALRFDPARNEWGPPQSLSAWVHPTIAMDGLGNAYVYELPNGNGADGEWPWSFWPAGAEALQPPKILAANGYLDVFPSPLAGAWLRQDAGDFSLRAFDVSTSEWGAESLSVTIGVEIFYVVVGATGQSLAVTGRHDATQFVIEVRRYDPALATWQPIETALSTELDDMAGYGSQLLSSSFGDTVVACAGHDLELRRRPATSDVWSSLQVFHDVQPLEWNFVEDESGDLYGWIRASELFHWNAASGASLTAFPGDDSFPSEWVTTTRGAFTLGSSSGQLVAHRHDGTEWRPARGLPPDIPAEGESPHYGLARLGQDRALVVWTGPNGRGPLYAAFLE